MYHGSEGNVTIADLFEEHRDRLSRYALCLSRRLDRADDLVQETFLRALTHAVALQEMNSHQQEAWLKRVLRNRFYDEERTHRRAQRLVRVLVSERCRPAGNVGLPDFDALLAAVPLEHEQLFVMRYRLGMTSAEIARELGIPSGTVRFRLHQCIQCLRTQMLQAVGKE
jgi:RNA polymerase sigma-70 factor, ECF subfamily